MKKLLSILLLLSILECPAAYSGRLDERGGHYDRRTGQYHNHRRPESSRPPQRQPAPDASAEIRPNSIHPVRVVRVVDGDMVDVTFDNGAQERVRLIGVDTPETRQPQRGVEYYGQKASDFTRSSLLDRDVWLQFDVRPRDRYRRLLGYIWLEEPNDADDEMEIRWKMFNARLLLEGFSQVMTIQPNSRYADLFVEFQREAREENKGLW